MDLKSEWALGEFRDPPIEWRLLDNSSSNGAAGGRGSGQTSSGSPQLPAGDVGKAASPSGGAVGGRRRVLSTRSAYQGERLAGLLVVKFEAGDEERRSRWRRFGTALNVELEITTEAVAAAGTAFLSEEPSLWRDYEGRENARDRGVLARSNRTVSLSPESSPRKELPMGDLVYAVDVEVQVPVDFLGQRVYLEALVSPVSESQRESGGTPDPFSASTPSRNAANTSSSGDGGGANSGGGGGGRRRGVGGDFANRLDGLFALSRVAPVRLPVRRCFLPLRVVQPITVTSRSCPCSSPSSSSPSAGPGSCSAFAGAIGRCLVAIEVRNDHPAATVTLHDVEVHVDATARCGERASSQGFSAPGKSASGGGGGGGGGSGRVGVGGRTRKMSGGVLKGGASAPLEGLDGSIEQPLLAGGGGSSAAGTSFSRVFCASWVAKPPLPLELAPGEVQGFVLSISPAGEAPLPPRRAGGRFESPVTFVWTLDTAGGACSKKSGTAPAWASIGSSSSTSSSSLQRRSPPSSARSRSPSPVPLPLGAGALGKKRPPPPPPPPPATTTSVHLAQWQSEQRARDEVLVRVNGQPRVKLNRVFEVSLRVRNLSDSARDLVVMFTEEPSDGGCRRGDGAGGQHQLLSLDGNAGHSGGRGRRRNSDGVSVGSGTDSDEDDDDGAVKDISPSASPVHHSRGVSFTTGASNRSPQPPRLPPRRNAASATAAASPSAPISLVTGDLLPVDSAVPLGRLERGAEHGATVRLTAARAGLARLSSLCLRDSLTGSVYVPACPYEVFVES